MPHSHLIKLSQSTQILMRAMYDQHSNCPLREEPMANDEGYISVAQSVTVQPVETLLCACFGSCIGN